MSVLNSVSEIDVKSLSVPQIQEDVKSKLDRLNKLDNKFFLRTFLIGLPLIGIPTFFSVLWAAENNVSAGMLMLINTPHLLLVGAYLMVMIFRDSKKRLVLVRDLRIRKEELVLKDLGGGEFVGVPALSSGWNTVKVRKSGDVREYMVRLSNGENGLPFAETKTVQ